MSKDRYEELSGKLFEIGRSLNNEGYEKNDITISSIGDILILASGLIFEKDDVKDFTVLCEMFSSKKIIDAYLSGSPLHGKSRDEMSDFLANIKDGLDEDFNKFGRIDDDDDDEEDEDEEI
jgi:hypothetical protein